MKSAEPAEVLVLVYWQPVVAAPRQNAAIYSRLMSAALCRGAATGQEFEDVVRFAEQAAELMFAH